jgi:hypothetical protein
MIPQAGKAIPVGPTDTTLNIHNPAQPSSSSNNNQLLAEGIKKARRLVPRRSRDPSPSISPQKSAAALIRAAFCAP